MPTEWFYQRNGDVIGPITPSELLAGVRKGVIQHDSLIRKDDSQWVAACEVGGLFEAAKRDLVQYHCPFCGARVHKPPTTCIDCSREITAVYRHREKVSDLPDHEKPEARGKEENGEQRGLIRWLKSFMEWD